MMKNKNKMISLQFVPHSSIEHLSSLGKIKKLLKMTKENQIVLLEGRLKKEEEAELIKTTMEEIDDDFKGIELAVINPEKTEGDIIHKTKNKIISLLLGRRQGLTVIGPSTLVKEIKKDPNKIIVCTQEGKNHKRKTK